MQESQTDQALQGWIWTHGAPLSVFQPQWSVLQAPGCYPGRTSLSGALASEDREWDFRTLLCLPRHALRSRSNTSHARAAVNSCTTQPRHQSSSQPFGHAAVAALSLRNHESTRGPQATMLHAARGAKERTELVETWTGDREAAFESPDTKPAPDAQFETRRNRHMFGPAPAPLRRA